MGQRSNGGKGSEAGWNLAGIQGGERYKKSQVFLVLAKLILFLRLKFVPGCYFSVEFLWLLLS